MSDKLFILNKMFEYMSEIKQYTSFNFSGSPEYVDVFNDESTSLASDNEIILGAASTGYSIALGLGINIYTNYLDGTNVLCTSASTSSSWGRRVYAKYTGPDKYGLLESGKIYQFIQNVTDSPNKNSYYHNTIISCNDSSCATTIQNDLKNTTFNFSITSFDGHEVPYDFSISDKLSIGVLMTSGQSQVMRAFPAKLKALYISAMTYNITYTSGTTSTSATEAIRNSKIGTKYTVTTAAKDKTAKTISGGSYVYSTSCVYDTSALMLKPYYPFFIQTSAQSLTINYERLGSVSSGETYDLSSYSTIPKLLLPIQESNHILATMNSIANTDTGGLGISIFNSIFNNKDDNFKHMVITPNQYDVLTPSNLPLNVTYTYYKPTLFFKNAGSSNNYCLRMNDISTFDKWMYLLGGKTSSANTSTNNDFDYKNYDSTNIINGSDWASNNSDKNSYFTLILK